MTRDRLRLPLWLLLLTAWSLNPANAQDISVTFAGDNLRELAQKHLGNPDLWPDILYANGLQSLEQLRPGTVLKIPAQVILAVEKETQEVRQMIQAASQQGARVLAAETVAGAIEQQNQALAARRQGDWTKALEQARVARALAEQALAETARRRNQPAEALLEHAGGTVQRRPPGSWAWQIAQTGAALIEQEKLRTLSESFAEVRFRDDSRLRLNANAQLLIQQMRVDDLNQRKQTEVMLQGGDIYALLGGTSRTRDFSVSAVGVDSKIDSSKFWVERGQDATRFANYDSAGIEVSSAGQSVVLGQNQGTLVQGARPPSAPRELPPPPEDLLPADYTVVYHGSIEFQWNAQPQAAAYWLEVASDREFKRLVKNVPRIAENRLIMALPPDGLYYWRVSSVDAGGFPGPKSQTRFFKAQRDNTPPYLVISEPADNAALAQSEVEVRGLSESNARIVCMGQPVSVGPQGEFSCPARLQPGRNELAVEATDPAGNTQQVKRAVRYLAADQVPLDFDGRGQESFINRSPLTLRGTTLPGAALAFQAGEAQYNTVADAEGRFQINLPLQPGPQVFQISARLPSGQQGHDELRVELDTTPPRLALDNLPALTPQAQANLSGAVEDAETLDINGTAVAINQGRFTHTLALKEGDNTITLTVRDRAGNQSIEQRRIRLDTTPPHLEKPRITPTIARGGETVSVEIAAQDAGGLKASASFSLQAGGVNYTGYLKLCPDNACYQGTLPVTAAGKIQLLSVTAEDYAGNRGEWRNSELK